MPRQRGDHFQIIESGKLVNEPDHVPARKTSTASKPSIDATLIELARSTQAKERSHLLRQAVQNGGDFEIIGHGELDDEFDLIDSEVPSVVNGSVLSDANAMIDRLNGAFRAGWDDDE